MIQKRGAHLQSMVAVSVFGVAAVFLICAFGVLSQRILSAHHEISETRKFVIELEKRHQRASATYARRLRDLGVDLENPARIESSTIAQSDILDLGKRLEEALAPLGEASVVQLPPQRLNDALSAYAVNVSINAHPHAVIELLANEPLPNASLSSFKIDAASAADANPLASTSFELKVVGSSTSQ